MPGGTDALAQGGEIISDRTGRVRLHDQNRFVAPVQVGFQLGFHLIQVHRSRFAEIYQVDFHPEPFSHAGPEDGEASRRQGKHPVPAGEDVGQGCLPGAVPVGDVDGDFPGTPGHPVQIRNHAFHHFVEGALVDIRCSLVHCLQDAVRNHRRTRNGKIVTAVA